MIKVMFQFFRQESARWLLWGFTAAALLYGLGTAPLAGAERVCLQAIRRISGPDGIFALLPVSGAETPLWFLWSSSAVLQVLPETWSTWGLRFVSAAAALIVLWVLRKLALRIFDRQTAAVAGWMLAGSCVFLVPGRMGLPLMTVSAAAMLTVGCFFLCPRMRFGGNIYLFWCVFFIGAWSGGLSTQCAVLPFLLPFCLNRKRSPFFFWHQIPAFLLGVAVYLVPLLAVKTPETLRGFGMLILQELKRDFAESTPLRTPSADLWYYSLLPFFALQITAVWGACLQWRKLSRFIRCWGVGLLLTCGYWCLLPDEGAAPTLLLPCSTVFFAAVLLSPAFDRYRIRVLKGIRVLAVIAPAVLVCGLVFFAAGETLFHMNLWGHAAWMVAGCGLLGMAVMFMDEQLPSFWSRWSGMPRELAAQILCFSVLTAFFLSAVVPMIP